MCSFSIVMKKEFNQRNKDQKRDRWSCAANLPGGVGAWTWIIEVAKNIWKAKSHRASVLIKQQ